MSVARGGEMLGMSVWCEWPARCSLRSQVGAQVAGAGPGTGPQHRPSSGPVTGADSASSDRAQFWVEGQPGTSQYIEDRVVTRDTVTRDK